MKKTLFKIQYFLLIVLINGCASVYNPINPTTVNYSSHDLKDGVSLSYKYDVLREKGNRKYAKKEIRSGIKVVSVKITNNTDTLIQLGENFAFYSGNSQVPLIEPMAIKSMIKQPAPGYILYLLLTPLKLFVANENSVETYSIGYVLGPGLALGNMAVAGIANTNLETELNYYSLYKTKIEKGKTAYGIVGLMNSGYDPVSLRNIKKMNAPVDVQKEFISLDDMVENKESNEESLMAELRKQLYKTDTNEIYEAYYNRVLKFNVHPGIESIDIIREEYKNGSLKSIGLKAKHQLIDTDDDIYSGNSYNNQIGTWRYFYENGQLKILVDYNIKGQRDGRHFEYDETGNLIAEMKYKSGKKIK